MTRGASAAMAENTIEAFLPARLVMLTLGGKLSYMF